MQKLLKWYQAQSKTIKAIIIFSTTLATIYMLFLVVTIQMSCRSQKLMNPYFTADTIIEKQISAMKRPIELSAEKFEMLKIERKVLNVRKKHHYDLSLIFFENYYGVIIVLMALSCIGGVILFILINRGWSNAGITLQSFFLALAICVTFFGFFPAVFDQEKNLNQNLISYMNYSKAEMNILNQLSFLNSPSFAHSFIEDSLIKKRINRFDSLMYNKAVDSIIDQNAKTINSLMNYVLNINSSEIKSIGDIAKMLSTYQTGGVADSASNH